MKQNLESMCCIQREDITPVKIMVSLPRFVLQCLCLCDVALVVSQAVLIVSVLVNEQGMCIQPR